jgi:hypothetical protein
MSFSAEINAKILHFSATCSPPEVAFGHVAGEASNAGRVYLGTVKCMAGYELVGKSLIKCMDGIWSAEIPVCTRETFV